MAPCQQVCIKLREVLARPIVQHDLIGQVGNACSAFAQLLKQCLHFPSLVLRLREGAEHRSMVGLRQCRQLLVRVGQLSLDLGQSGQLAIQFSQPGTLGEERASGFLEGLL